VKKASLSFGETIRKLDINASTVMRKWEKWSDVHPGRFKSSQNYPKRQRTVRNRNENIRQVRDAFTVATGRVISRTGNRN
jgi:hypothetical protein